MLRLLKNVKQLSVSGGSAAGRGAMAASMNFGTYEPNRNNKHVSLAFFYFVFFLRFNGNDLKLVELCFKLNSLEKIEMRYEFLNL